MISLNIASEEEFSEIQIALIAALEHERAMMSHEAPGSNALELREKSIKIISSLLHRLDEIEGRFFSRKKQDEMYEEEE